MLVPQEKNHTLSDYINKYYSAHTELAHISEVKKVDNFLKGLTGLRFKTVKENVINDTSKNGNLTSCHQYVQTVQSQMLQQDKADC